MRKVVSILPAVFLHERFESTPILGKIKWRLLREHGISRFAGFLENEIILETLIVIFVNSSPKGLSWPNMKKFGFSVLTLNSRYLQSAALRSSLSSLFWNKYSIYKHFNLEIIQVIIKRLLETQTFA